MRIAGDTDGRALAVRLPEVRGDKIPFHNIFYVKLALAISQENTNLRLVANSELNRHYSIHQVSHATYSMDT